MRLLNAVKNIFRAPPPAHPSFARNHALFKEVDQDRPINDYDFVVVDTELTGLSQRHDEIVAIGAVRISGMHIMAGHTFYTLVKPAVKIDATSATFIHQITPQELAVAPEIAEALPPLVDFCGSAFMVGHYVDLDSRFLNRAAQSHFQTSLRTPCLDTMRLAQIYAERLWGRHNEQYNLQVSYNLTDLCKEYKLPLFPAHNALQDAMQTAYLFVFLVKQLQGQGLVTLKDFFQAGQSWNRII
ncbi:MAG: 3'-5' exonuclease [Thermodesulfobacteriota bacterium]